MAFSICKLCNTEHHVQSGSFSRHLNEIHNMTLKDYVVQFEYNGIPPKCQCGYCDDEPMFYRGKFKTHASGHKKYDYLKEQYIKYNGVPKCNTCGSEITSWHRGLPRKYCDIKCRPSTWNQDKVRETVRSKYGVDNAYQIPEVIDKIQSKLDYEKISRKAVETKRKRYKNGAYNPDAMKNTMQGKYGVDHPSQISKNRKTSSSRMKLNNPMYNIDTAKKATETLFKNIELGKTKLFNTKQYKNTNLYYQSSYEFDFLEHCENLGILHKIDNGRSYEYINEDIRYGNRLLTDFTLDDLEIEIKSTYILHKQGGLAVINAKQRAVNYSNKTYILILDKDYREFDLFINK